MQLNASCTPGGPGGRQNVTVITEDKHMYVRMYPVHIVCTGYWVLGGAVAMVTVTSSVSVLPKRCGWREESQRLVSGGYSPVSGRVYPLKEVPSPGLRWGGLSVSS